MLEEDEDIKFSIKMALQSSWRKNNNNSKKTTTTTKKKHVKSPCKEPPSFTTSIPLFELTRGRGPYLN